MEPRNTETSDYDVEQYLNKELLRFTTAGSVDDGKSTLIGRLLFDSKAIFQDQLEQLEQSSRLRGEDGINLALLTDGLRSEREQGITIDVAYRYFATPKRKFIIADTPGHEQYTRNMVTGASTADLAIILIDARYGVLVQSRRHGFIASLLGIPHLLICINKMDLVGYSQDVFQSIVGEFSRFAQKLNIGDLTFIPISALNGDNIVDSSRQMDWYRGTTVLHHLENVTISTDRNLIDFRFPVQYVLRPNLDFRGFCGRISSGTIRRGEEIMALPSRKRSRIRKIVTFEGNLEEAAAGQSVTLTLEDEIDISRGEMIVRVNNQPRVETRFEATLCWMDDTRPLRPGTAYLVQHTSRIVRGIVRELRYQIDVNTIHRTEVDALELNDIGRVVIETAMPLFLDPYRTHRETGSFVLIDPATNLTVAAGMVRYATSRTDASDREELMFRGVSHNVLPFSQSVGLENREQRNGHLGHVVWLTGLVRSGKSTIAGDLARRLFSQNRQVFNLDGDMVRHGLCGDLGFSERDRRENIRRVAHAARMLAEAGQIVICSLISPRREMREFVRKLLPEGRFTEVYVKCPIDECRKRDSDQLYSRADSGDILNFTGVTGDYEEPQNPDVVVDTRQLSLADCVGRVLDVVNSRIGLP